MKIIELINIAFSSITSNKTRSLLTMLGLIIGISSVVTILAIGEGSQNSIEDNLGSLGLNNFNVSYERNIDLAPYEEFNAGDLEAIETTYPDQVVTVLPDYSGNGTIISNITETSVSIKGSNEFLKTIENLTLLSGRSLMSTDINERRSVILIDNELASDLYPEEAIGQKIMIKSGKTSHQYLIIGIYEKEDNALGFSNSTVYIPYTTADKQLNKKGHFDSMTISTTEEANIEELSSQVVSLIEKRHRNINENKYRVFSLSSQIDMVSDVMGQVTLLVSAIAGISLVVGGIGVMNIMLVSVTERTREIGIRKALGAKRMDILIQFLIEAVTICIIGGLIGVFFGAMLTEVAENLMNVSMNISLSGIMLATSFSMLIGIVFGVYPANKASKLDPIEALRYE